MGSVIAFLSTLIFGLLPIRLSDVSYTFKWIISYLCIRLYNKFKKNRLDIYDLEAKGQPERVGFIAHPTEEKLESPCPESHLASADDEIFFYGVNSKGDCLIVSVSRLCNQKAEATVYLKLASGKVYELMRKTDYQQSCGNKNSFTCGGLQTHYICPMRIWRIFYSGFLKETSEEIPGVSRMVYVKFAFLWRASSNVYDNTAGMNESEIAESVAKQNWENIIPPVHKIFNILDFYAEAGVIMGTVNIEESKEDFELYLFGEKVRFLGDTSLSKEIEFSHILGFVHENGTYLHFGKASATNITKDVNYGFVVKPSGNLKEAEKLDISITTDSGEGNVQRIRGKIEAGRPYMFCGSVQRSVTQTCSKEKNVTVNHVKFFLDGKRGSGIIIKGKFNKSRRKISDTVPPMPIPECVYPMVVTFIEDLCQVPEITGGKGSSLGKLTWLSEELQTFTVPSGVVVTTASYKQFITADILCEIRNLEDILCGNKEGDGKEACKRISDKIISTKLPNPVIDNIAKYLKKVFGDKFKTMKFAIRSSATGEDTELMSAAGQMETFLGVTGFYSILTAVKKCWASQFGFTAVQYKRRYGQCLNSSMAVVIQEMVPCDVAGVIFTCDPVSGNTSKISIAANFGLGETVVSASVDPDTIELARDANDCLRIHNVTAGSKNQKIILTDHGTSLQDIAEEEKRECCLSSEDIFRLGNLAIRIEKSYRCKRDIEWGIKNGNIYLFQSRPVTSGTQETDFEIEHELDGPLRVENDYFSVSNTGEVLPGANSFLSLDVSFRMFTVFMQGDPEVGFQTGVKARYFPTGFVTVYNHTMFNIPDMLRKRHNRSNFDKAIMVAFFGRILNNEEIFRVASDRYADEQETSWKSLYKMVKCFMFSGRRLRNAEKSFANYRIPVEKYSTSKELFNSLTKRCCDLNEPLMSHLVCTQVSSMWNMLILSVLSQDKKEMDTDVYTDFAKLITLKGNVESADVPLAIENLVFHITKFIKPEVFKAMKTEDALKWLTEASSSAGEKFKEFINKHGHRCFKEFDIYSTTWESDQKSLVRLLQKYAGSISNETLVKRNTSVVKEILQLKTPIGLLSKLKLLLLVPLSRKGVQDRESSKSLAIRGMNVWRKGYRELAKRMVSEGRIPDENILFFMTLDEIKELLESRSPKVLAKAYHRQRLYPKMNEYRFPEIMRGIPKPINRNADQTYDVKDDFSMKGIPVSQGVARGYIRVATTLAEADHLKPGEILLAYGTDIGWTPYFPTLAGVATELGGLISHGAVVSREYGLPAIAGLHGATRIFRTGDYVLLDGNKGVLQKIPPPEC